MKTVGLMALVLSVLFAVRAQEPRFDGAGYPEVQYGAQTYKDPHSRIILYVESDARHVSAITPAGKLLWTRDPFKDARLELYRTKHPQIAHIGPAASFVPGGQDPRNFVNLAFNSSQFGVLRLSDGEFLLLGEN